MGDGKQSNAMKLASIETMLSERLRQSEKFETEVKSQLTKLVANGNKAITVEDMKNAIVAHIQSCPSRASISWSKDSWKVLTGIVALATGLSLALREVLQMLAKYV